MASSPVMIRQVELKEAEALHSLAIETFVDTYGSANTAENMDQYLAENFTIARISEELKDPHSKSFFALLNEDSSGVHDINPAGYIKLNLQKGILDSIEKNGMEIERIYVKKKFQGKQIGKLLFDTAVEIAKKTRHNYLWLGVWEKNPHAISFYEKMGFTRAGNHLFKLGEDLQKDIIMRYDI